ncbi:MAG TPA: hypothetical protein VIG77_05440, partial [Ktedonobacterales bacterium]
METRAVVESPAASSARGAERPTRAVRRRFQPRMLIPYLFVLPFFVLFVAFFVAPLVYAFQQSLYKTERSGL